MAVTQSQLADALATSREEMREEVREEVAVQLDALISDDFRDRWHGAALDQLRIEQARLGGELLVKLTDVLNVGMRAVAERMEARLLAAVLEQRRADVTASGGGPSGRVGPTPADGLPPSPDLPLGCVG